ncbi:MAG: orotate phosphoribosyltransferase [Bacteroidales bacterium]|nr:MAG: orotate phosphoribosyltransferase [Bacteroidales bacterium]
MSISEKQVASLLLQIKAIKINVAKPFQWTSGWKSPIYCDNRKTLSYPKIRNVIKEQFIELINNKFRNVEAIAGIATGAIAIGAIIADALNLPFLYVRSNQKDHGLQNLIEGETLPNQRIVVIEDLVSTGGSSLKAVNTLRNNNCNVLGLAAIFTYQFKATENRFDESDCKLYTLCNFEILVDLAKQTGYISSEELAFIKQWHKNPENWGADN